MLMIWIMQIENKGGREFGGQKNVFEGKHQKI